MPAAWKDVSPQYPKLARYCCRRAMVANGIFPPSGAGIGWNRMARKAGEDMTQPWRGQTVEKAYECTYQSWTRAWLWRGQRLVGRCCVWTRLGAGRGKWGGMRLRALVPQPTAITPAGCGEDEKEKGLERIIFFQGNGRGLNRFFYWFARITWIHTFNFFIWCCGQAKGPDWQKGGRVFLANISQTKVGVLMFHKQQKNAFI
jgi:hypothetical protein